MGKKIDLTGQIFGRLTVIGEGDFYISPSGRKERTWHCRCDCGNEVNVRSTNLRHNTKSCGCLRKEITSKRYKVHGKSLSRLHKVWLQMKGRCYNPNNTAYKNYGGRGIKICDEWKDNFQAFCDWSMANGYDDTVERGKCTLDRIDVNGNYCPENCRWVSQKVQSRNTRQNIKIEYNGETKVLKDWALELGINYGTLYSRVHNPNWDIERCFTEPVNNHNK